MKSRYSIDQAYTCDNLSFFEKENYLPPRLSQNEKKIPINDLSPFDQNFYIEKTHLENQAEKDFFDHDHAKKIDLRSDKDFK